MAVTSMVFDSTYYLENNQDVATAVSQGLFASAEEHFNAFGWAEGRDPNANFDTSWYLANYDDVRNAKVNPLVHFQVYGAGEGRAPTENVSTSGTFNETAYLAANSDVQDAVTAGTVKSGYEHWIKYGQFEGRTATNTDGADFGGSASQTFTLTAAPDTGSAFTGGTGSDQFNGLTAGHFSALDDKLIGGSGTDTLLAVVANNQTFQSTTVDSIENLHFRATGAVTVDLTNATGYTGIRNDGSTGGALTITGISGTDVAAEIRGTNQNTILEYANTALSGSSDTVNVTLNGVTGAATVDLDAVTNSANAIETVGLESTGSANSIRLAGAGLGATTYNLTGSQDLTVAGTLTNATTIDASGMTAGDTSVTVGTTTLKYTGGVGDDTIAFAAAGDFTSADTIDGGAGTNTLSVNEADVDNLTSGTKFSNLTNIQALTLNGGLSAADVYDVTFVGSDITTVTSTGATGGATTINMNGGTSNKVEFNGALGAGLHTIDAAGTATTDVLEVNLDGGAADIGAGRALTTTDYETVNLTIEDDNQTLGNITVTPSAGGGSKFTADDTNGTYTLGTGTISAGTIDFSGMAGAVTMGGAAQVQANITGGSGADTLIGSTAADVISGGAGADTIWNTATGANATAGDSISGGDGFDTFTLVGDSASATNYNGAPNISDFTVGETATTTDLIRFSAANTDYTDDGAAASGLGDAGAVDGAAAADAIVVQTIAKGAAAAAVAGATVNFFKLTTGVAFDTNLQTTFDNALGTATVTGLTADSQIAGSYYDTTNSKMVIFNVDVDANTATTLEATDAVRLIGTIDMSADDYAKIDADNFAAFV